MTETLQAEKRASGRDANGRWLPGHSGNLRGWKGGRPSAAVNALADQAIEVVLRHDLDVVRRAKAQELKAGEDRPARNETEAALDRMARVAARRIVARSEAEIAAELRMADPEGMIEQRARLILAEVEREESRRASDALDKELEAVGLTGDADDGHEDTRQDLRDDWRA